MIKIAANFQNNKKTFLTKMDKSKKGDIDAKALPIINIINSLPEYYTTSSCSGRVYFWRSKGRKNETEWLKVSHDSIETSFFELEDTEGVIFLRVEDFIIHVACKDLPSANKLMMVARQMYKKSCFLSVSSKIVVEIKGSEFMDMPFYSNGKPLYAGDLPFLMDMIQQKLRKIWERREKLEEKIKKLTSS